MSCSYVTMLRPSIWRDPRSMKTPSCSSQCSRALGKRLLKRNGKGRVPMTMMKLSQDQSQKLKSNLVKRMSTGMIRKRKFRAKA
ncbi:hypothetical protein SKAU_G00360310 [Synaphobranchus kaupii]|uniref:Uncharacterized protein n=1 Tax=Synaphobranchus kaupii TaxID=118154 RepID=A0A9Q1EI82_SYNKA|nr:hypothetical protein SKAU_G00360310 [Synaphobranchus kaupii]